MDMKNSRRRRHTLVVSDLHLTEGVEPDPRRPLWMRHKQRDLHVDLDFSEFIRHHLEVLPTGSELVLNGDIFDFDAVLTLPTDPQFSISWLERLRGLSPESHKSRFKMEVIVKEHPVFFSALRSWVEAGNELIFVVGNHDMELHWPQVQEVMLAAIGLSSGARKRVRICPWFYISEDDTLIEHGNQYDSYCVCPDPLNPTLHGRNKVLMRIPFGDTAGRMMLNGMGLFNPYVESSFIKPLGEYVRFFFKQLAPTQPFIAWTWFWGAVATLVLSLRDGFRPPIIDPFVQEERENETASRSNTTPGRLRALRRLRVHPAIYNPWKIVRELWLDRALLLLVGVGTALQLFGMLNIFARVSIAWLIGPVLVVLPLLIFYTSVVRSEVNSTKKALLGVMPTALKMLQVERAIVGHTHVEEIIHVDGYEVINTGTWSAAFADVACTQPIGKKCFAYVRPSDSSPKNRVASLFAWEPTGPQLVEGPAPSELGAVGHSVAVGA